MKKFNETEIEFASSIMYYDQEEFENFVSIFDSIVSNNQIIVDGTFCSFINYLRKFNSYNDNPIKNYKGKIKFLSTRNQANPNKSERDLFDLWLNEVKSKDVDMELADDLKDHWLWEIYKDSISSIDKSNVPFSEKIKLRPIIITENSKSKIVDLNSIKLEEEKETESFKTGLDELDKFVKYCSTNLVVIAARPGVGKSLFMLQSAIANARNGVKTLFVSLEMGEKQLDKRIVFHIAGESLEDRHRDEYGHLDFPAYQKDYEEIKNGKLWKPIGKNLQLYVSKYSSANQILEELERHIITYKYKAIFIDYLQLLRYNNMDEWASLRALTKELKNLAFRLDCLIVIGSQVSRSSQDHGLILGDLFGSSTIEADADIVIGLENPNDRRPGNITAITVKVLKNREGDLADLKSSVDYSIGKITVTNY